MIQLQPVTPNELHVWRSIEAFQDLHGRWPKRTEIVEMTGWTDSKARRWLARLLEKGYLRFEGPRYSPATPVSIVHRPESVVPGTRLAVTLSPATTAEHRIVEAIRIFREREGRWPSRQEISTEADRGQSSVHTAIRALKCKGYVAEVDGYVARNHQCVKYIEIINEVADVKDTSMYAQQPRPMPILDSRAPPGPESGYRLRQSDEVTRALDRIYARVGGYGGR